MNCPENPFDFFDKIYCINLEEETERWNECVKESEKFNFKIERFNAIKPTHLSTHELNGRLGCAQSHCEIIKKAIEDNLETILILEDDFFFLQDREYVFSKIKKCLNELPDDWDCIYLGANIVNDYNPNPINLYSENLLKLNSCFSTHSIAYSKKGLAKFLSYFSSLEKISEELIEKYEAFDLFFAKEFLVNSNSFLCNELLVSQRDGFSFIEKRPISYTFDLVTRLESHKAKLLNL